MPSDRRFNKAERNGKVNYTEKLNCYIEKCIVSGSKMGKKKGDEPQNNNEKSKL